MADVWTVEDEAVFCLSASGSIRNKSFVCESRLELGLVSNLPCHVFHELDPPFFPSLSYPLLLGLNKVQMRLWVRQA